MNNHLIPIHVFAYILSQDQLTLDDFNELRQIDQHAVSLTLEKSIAEVKELIVNERLFLSDYPLLKIFIQRVLISTINNP